MVTAPATTAARERIRSLAAQLANYPAFRDAAHTLRAGEPLSLEGVVGGARALVLSALYQFAPRPLVIVCAAERLIDEIVDEWQLVQDRIAWVFPPWESSPGERDVADEIFGQRLRTLKRLRSAPDAAPVVVTTIQALQQPVLAPALLAEQSRVLRVGLRVDVEALRRWLVEQGFHATSAVDLPGEFAWRGGILDIFAADWDQPVRIEFFDEEIESLRQFDVATQRSSLSVDEVEITVLGPSRSPEHHLAEYFPPPSLIVLLEPDDIRSEARAYAERLRGEADEVFGLDEVLGSLAPFPVVTASALASTTSARPCHLPFESVEHFSGDISRVREELDQAAAAHEVLIVSQTDAESQRLAELLATSAAATEGRLQFLVGGLYGGFRFVSERAVVLSGADLFQRTIVRRPPKARASGRAIDSFLDLREGDLVVHLAHGIGRYRGLDLLKREGQAEEHLTIEFDAGVKVFVPASRINLIQKYVGGARGRPTLARLGGKSWVRQKAAAESAVRDIAADMLSLQAQRNARPGIAFAPDSLWQREFDAAFPYEETADQLLAVEAIKADMEAARPMDRLLCGDVGFGKTELAMRAAFKAAESGYQVAVLVPTTVLAEQHFRSFSERMAEFPIDIGKLSRFSSPAEQRETIAGLKSGRVDIVIGTHRLASKDVEFHNLGLVIIDEEQRFGVEVKERLKTLRTTVDILTLTATPIPRTLHMSLVGVRDISNLETAPADRMAVETKVTRWSDELIRHAVLRELSRNGQIYFVHNRVQDIQVVAQKLKNIVPEVRIGIGHGQLPENELERVMVDFVEHKFDLLLATTIVESGLDIPNANTIFIDEADNYGLADLHQLRGRVGRYKHRAHCYLLIDPRKHLTPNAAKRLLAIEEFSEMGAGFAISMRDLEIRGAGNLLGTEQSGHITAVGYELYCQLLENAVRALRRLPPQLSLDVEINLPINAYLPQEYVGDMRAKIDLYRRLSRLTSFEQLDDLRRELEDRFGPPPPPVLGMLQLAELRIEATVWQVNAIYLEEQFMVFRYADRGRMELLAKRGKHRLRFVDDQSVYLPLGPHVRRDSHLAELAKSVLRPGK